MFSTLDGQLFIMPICYHPTTILSVDDDPLFLKNLATAMSDQWSLLCFDKPSEAIFYIKNKHNYLPFTSRCLTDTNNGVKFNFKAIRNEIYNADRFKEIAVSVTDYNMPYISGIELMKLMEFHPEITQYSHIILTGKVSEEFKEKLTSFAASNEYIRKDDPFYLKNLSKLIEKRLARIFQWCSYVPARILSRIKDEKTSVLFDGNFATLLNQHIQKNNICEFYLFDKQGSYLFLDNDANPSWVFVRNELGIQNTIEHAKAYGAPKEICDALASKEVILSLYEKEDFEVRKEIAWEKYLLPTNVLTSNNEYLCALPGLISEKDNLAPKYYYAFTKEFPLHGIHQEKILSYDRFLQA